MAIVESISCILISFLDYHRFLFLILRRTNKRANDNTTTPIPTPITGMGIPLAELLGLQFLCRSSCKGDIEQHKFITSEVYSTHFFMNCHWYIFVVFTGIVII
jgi:hypothetical protein